MLVVYYSHINLTKPWLYGYYSIIHEQNNKTVASHNCNITLELREENPALVNRLPSMARVPLNKKRIVW